MTVLFLPEVEEYLSELIYILYSKNYFNFYDSAATYVEELISDIERNIHIKAQKEAPAYFAKYGKDLRYITSRPNKNTTWYIFFTKHKEETYLIRYISNNHVIGQYIL